MISHKRFHYIIKGHREFSCRDRHRADGRRFFPEKEETVIV